MKSPFTRSAQRCRRLAPLAVVVVLGLGSGFPLPSQAGPLDDVLDPPDTLPNLVPDVRGVWITGLPVFDPETQTFVTGPPVFAFDTYTQNLGTVSLELTIDEVSTAETTPVAQCVSWIEDRICRERSRVGGITFHEPHNHFHFDEFGSYQLRRLGADGRPDYSEAGLVAVSNKVSFCLFDSEPVRDDAFPMPFYITCDRAMQGLSPGWADIYGFSLPGQQFPLDGLTDGRYALIVDLDYANHVYETDDTDNVVEVTVEVSGGVTQAAIIDKRWPIPDDGDDEGGKDKKDKKPKKKAKKD